MADPISPLSSPLPTTETPVDTGVSPEVKTVEDPGISITKHPRDYSSLSDYIYQQEIVGQKGLVDLTQHEIVALRHDLNLADAHTHQSQSLTQRAIVDRLPQLWYEAEKTKQSVLEQRFIETFFTLRRQHRALKTSPTMLVYAASIGMIATANYLKQKQMMVTLIEPCFDNLPGIMKNMDVPMESFDEMLLSDPAKIYDNLVKNVKGDALFLVDPNNPSGFTLSQFGRKGWEEVMRFCKDNNKLLVLDVCFGVFLYANNQFEIIDLYEMAENMGVSYIIMEDTGKTWPLQDAKISLLKTSADVYPDMMNIHTSYLLNVSPFVLNLLTQYLLDSQKDNFSSVFTLLERNRAVAERELQGSLLEVQPTTARLSVVWARIKDENINATDLQRIIQEKAGVYVLPGTYFYWDHPQYGERFIRLALARDTEVFEEALKKLRQVVDNI